MGWKCYRSVYGMLPPGRFTQRRTSLLGKMQKWQKQERRQFLPYYYIGRGLSLGVMARLRMHNGPVWIHTRASQSSGDHHHCHATLSCVGPRRRRRKSEGQGAEMIECKKGRAANQECAQSARLFSCLSASLLHMYGSGTTAV